MSEIKWNGYQIIEFFNIYRKYDCLWDVSSPNYLKKNRKDSAFRSMIEELNAAGLHVTLDSLKKKMKSLRDTYRLELNRVRKSRNGGAGSEEIYRPKLIWYSAADSFLHNVLIGRESSSNLDISTQPPEVDEDDMKEDQDFPEVQQQMSLNYMETMCPSTLRQSTNQPSNPFPRDMASKTQHAKIRKIKGTKHNWFLSAVEKLHKIAQIKAIDQEDQYDKFGKHIACQLRELPLRNFILLQDKIQSLLTSERLTCMESQSSVQALPSVFSSSNYSILPNIGHEDGQEIDVLQQELPRVCKNKAYNVK